MLPVLLTAFVEKSVPSDPSFGVGLRLEAENGLTLAVGTDDPDIEAVPTGPRNDRVSCHALDVALPALNCSGVNSRQGSQYGPATCLVLHGSIDRGNLPDSL